MFFSKIKCEFYIDCTRARQRGHKSIVIDKFVTFVFWSLFLGLLRSDCFDMTRFNYKTDSPCDVGLQKFRVLVPFIKALPCPISIAINTITSLRWCFPALR